MARSQFVGAAVPISSGFKVQGADFIIKKLRTVRAAVNKKITRRMLRAIGKVFEDSATSRIRRLTGFTLREIKVSVRRTRGTTDEMSAIIGPSRANHPIKSGKSGKGMRASDVGRWLEFGTKDMPAKPWLRPAFHTAKSQAASAGSSTFRKEFTRATR